MNDKELVNYEILNPVGIDKVCEDIASNILGVAGISRAFGRTYRHKINNKYKPCYFGQISKVSDTPTDMSVNRSFCKPAYSFCFPHGSQTVLDEEETGSSYRLSQNLSLIVVLNFTEYDNGLNHLFYENLKVDILSFLRKMSYFSEITLTDEPQKVWREFDVIEENHFDMHPYGSIRIDMKAIFNNCE